MWVPSVVVVYCSRTICHRVGGKGGGVKGGGRGEEGRGREGETHGQKEDLFVNIDWPLVPQNTFYPNNKFPKLVMFKMSIGYYFETCHCISTTAIICHAMYLDMTNAFEIQWLYFQILINKINTYTAFKILQD